MAQYSESFTAPYTGNCVGVGIGGGGAGITGGGLAYYPSAGGGQAVIKEVIPIVNATVYTIFRGKGGSTLASANGGDTDFRIPSTVLLAKGGTIPSGGLPSGIGRGDVAGSVGDIIHFGGNAGIGDAAGVAGGGGGGGGGMAGPGTDGGPAGVTPGAAGQGGDTPPAGNGAAGATGVGLAPVEPGGGGGTGINGNAGHDGADGAWAIWRDTDWDYVLHAPKPGTTPLAFGGAYPPAPPPTLSTRNQGSIM